MFAKLAELFVQFSTQGFDTFTAAFDQAKAKMESVHKAAEALGSASNRTFGLMTAAVMDWVKAGIAASGVGQILTFQLGLLARTIAGLFQPEIREAILLIQRFTQWLQNLTDAQKEHISTWLKIVGVVGVILGVLPKLISTFSDVRAAIKAINTTLISTGWGAIIVVVGLVAGAIATFLTVTKSGRKVLEQLGEAFMPIVNIVLKLIENIYKLTLGPIFAAALPILNAVVRAFQPLLNVLDEVMGAFNELTEVFGEVFALLGEAALEPLKLNLELLAYWLKNVVVPIIKLVAEGLREAANLLRTFLGLPAPKHPGARGPLAPPAGGPEAVENVFARAQAAALKGFTALTPEETVADESKKHTVLLENIKNLLTGKPTVITGLIGGK